MINKNDVIFTKNLFAVKVSKNKLLIGHKGKSFLEQGYVYAPYVPMIVTPAIGPSDKVKIEIELDPIKIIMKRMGYE